MEPRNLGMGRVQRGKRQKGKKMKDTIYHLKMNRRREFVRHTEIFELVSSLSTLCKDMCSYTSHMTCFEG